MIDQKPTLAAHSIASVEALFHDFGPVMARLMRQYEVALTSEERQDLFASLVQYIDLASGVPLRPWLMRRLTAWFHLRSHANGNPHYRPPACDLMGLIPALPDLERQAFSLRYLEGKSVAEIAEALEQTPDQVGKTLQAARDQLRLRARLTP